MNGFKKSENCFQSGGFDRECLVYGKILPMLEDLRKSSGLKPITFPKCFYASSEKKIIIMEHLRAKEFAMVNYKGKYFFIHVDFCGMNSGNLESTPG